MRTPRLLLLISIACLLAGNATAQFSLLKPKDIDEDAMNLVPNASFEEVTKYPCKWNQGLGRFDKWSVSWTSPTETTPDIISKKAVPNCWAHARTHSEGKQAPHDGDTMIGIKVFGTGGSDTYWHEYVQVELEEPLKKDSLYFAYFWVNLSAKASKATNNIGMAVTDTKTKTGTRLPLYITPQINSADIIQPKLFGWKRVSGVFKSNGTETHLMIGNFYGDEQTKMERLDRGKDGAYYYIDDVMLRRALPSERNSK